MRAAITLLVLLFSMSGAKTRSTQSKVQKESQGTGMATAVAAALVSTRQDVSTEINELKTAVFDLKTQMLELTSILNFNQDQLDNTKKLLYKTTAETENLKEAYDNLTQGNAAQQLEIITLKTRLDTSEAEVEGLKAKNAALQQDMSTTRSDVTNLTASNTAQEAELTAMKSNMARLKEENALLQANISIVKTETANLIQVTTAQETELSVINIRLTTSEDEVENLKQGYAAQQAELTMLDGRLSTSEAEVATIKEHNTALQADMNTTRAEMALLAEANAAQDVELTELRNRQAVSETEVENVKGENAAIMADMTIVKTELMTLTEQNAAQDSELERVKMRLATGEAVMEDVTWENGVQNDELAVVKAGLAATNAEVEAIKTGTTATPKVAFSAGLLDSSAGYVEAGETRRTLIFRKITTNVGGAYSGITGVFRAPVRGVYYFRFTVKDYLAARYMDISMWRNEQQVLWLDGYDTDGHAAYLSTGATLQLEAGDAVNMRIRAGSRLYDSYGEHSTFSGFLLFTI